MPPGADLLSTLTKNLPSVRSTRQRGWPSGWGSGFEPRVEVGGAKRRQGLQARKAASAARGVTQKEILRPVNLPQNDIRLSF